ncbi:MAG: hypothetical protein C4547_02630 [Phycisphaerales bacterium]|nr:MAG: hypothetical protein C4547_02630 [Phycisphaerales bacterium]
MTKNECSHPGADAGCRRCTPRRPVRAVRLIACLIAAGQVLAALPALAADPDNCLWCHQYRGLARYDAQRDQVHVFHVDPAHVYGSSGPHARLACTDCHSRAEVGVVPHRPVSAVDCTTTCHLADPAGLERRFSHRGVEAALAGGPHDPARMSDLRFQVGTLLQPGQSHCLYCHDEPLYRDALDRGSAWIESHASTEARCNACHADQIGVDVEYYLHHVGARLKPARSTMELAQVCAVCHSDAQVRAVYGLPDSVASYMRSFHGKAALLGDETTANCLSCHVRSGQTVHSILPQGHPESAVFQTRLADRCRTTDCHPGAAVSIADSSVHFDIPTSAGTVEYALVAAFILLTLGTFGPSAAIALLELFQILVGRREPQDHAMRELTERVMRHPDGPRRLVRFSAGQRLQHWLLAILFTVLVITGFPLKFADTGWARWVIEELGGLAAARQLHHGAGLLLMLGLVAHVVSIVLLVAARARRVDAQGRRVGFLTAWFALPMWVTMDDARKALQLFAYLLGLSRQRPTFGRFNVKEKFEYIGVFWGTVLLGVTGLLLWGEQAASRFISGRIMNLAAIAHTYEAFLALIHVGILHIYNVILAPHVFPLSPATLSGRTPVEELADGHSDFVRQAAAELGIQTGSAS